MRLTALLCLLLVSASASAYIGPGSGLSVLSSLWMLLAGIGIALFAVLAWPIRYLWRRLRGRKPSGGDRDTDRSHPSD